MHEDICNLAEDKLITLIIVPFHKKQTVDGAMEAVNPALRHLNQNILANAPCSIGILIDKGHGGSANHVSLNIAIIFIGGPDDREALAYGLRMAENSSANLTILQLVPGDEIKQSIKKKIKNNDTLKVISDMEREAQLDNEYITDFKLRTMGQETIVYNEKVVNNVEETITSICSMDGAHNFFIVGRGQGIESILIAGLNEFSDCPELGAVGDILASSDFATTGYVLVVQQYVGKRKCGDENKISLEK